MKPMDLGLTRRHVPAVGAATSGIRQPWALRGHQLLRRTREATFKWPSQTCLAARCLAESVCRPWMLCTPRCAQDDLQCQLLGHILRLVDVLRIRCGDLYKPTDGSSGKIDDFGTCAISEHHCVPQEQLSCHVPQRPRRTFDLASLVGRWYATKRK